MVRLTMDLIARGTSGFAKKKTDESIQKYLKRISHLYLENRGIDEVGDDLGLCRNLVVLYLYDNSLSKVPNLNGNCNLTHLYLQNNQLCKMDGLNSLKKLTKLYIGGNKITVVEGLEKLELLQELHMENQRLPTGEKLLFDPRTLVSLSRCLEVLNISGNNLDCIRDLQCLRFLTQFMASDNNLNDMKELAHVVTACPRLWRLDLMGNPLCHKAKYRDRIIIMASTLEVLDGKEVSDTAKQFLKNWQASREMAKRKQETLLRQGTQATEMSGDGRMNDGFPYSSQASHNMGIDVPGYMMPAMPRKQSKLTKSASVPSTTLNSREASNNFSDYSSGPRYLNTYGTLYHEGSTVNGPPTAAPPKLSMINMGSNPAGDGVQSFPGMA